MSIKESSKVKHQFSPALLEDYNKDKLIFTVIIDCYYNLNYVKESISSVLDQDYHNVELMLIDNGAIDGVSRYLTNVYEKNKNTALVRFKDNQFSWDYIEKAVAICWNAGLIHAKGDIIAHLAYDDKLSKNYASKMIKLFVENDNCMTAAPLPVSINQYGEINKKSNLIQHNNRSRYTRGKQLAIDYVKGSPNKMFSAPGEIFALRKSLLFELGGFNPNFDSLQVIKFAIYGDTGFDPSAHVYWRHHKHQLNRVASKRGFIYCTTFREDMKNSNVIDIWEENFTLSEIELLRRYLRDTPLLFPLRKAKAMVSRKDLVGLSFVLLNTVKECPKALGKTIAGTIYYVLTLIKNKILRVFGYTNKV